MHGAAGLGMAGAGGLWGASVGLEGAEEEEEEGDVSGDEGGLGTESRGAGVEGEARWRGEGGGLGPGDPGDRGVRGTVLGVASGEVGVLEFSPGLTGENGSTVTPGDAPGSCVRTAVFIILMSSIPKLVPSFLNPCASIVTHSHSSSSQGSAPPYRNRLTLSLP